MDRDLQLAPAGLQLVLAYQRQTATQTGQARGIIQSDGAVEKLPGPDCLIAR